MHFNYNLLLRTFSKHFNIAHIIVIYINPVSTCGLSKYLPCDISFAHTIPVCHGTSENVL